MMKMTIKQGLWQTILRKAFVYQYGQLPDSAGFEKWVHRKASDSSQVLTKFTGHFAIVYWSGTVEFCVNITSVPMSAEQMESKHIMDTIERQMAQGKWE